MNPQESTLPSNRPATIVHQPWKLLAQVNWWLLALLSLTVFIVNLPQQFEELTLHWITTSLPPSVVQEGLDRLGITPETCAAIGVAVYILKAAR